MPELPEVEVLRRRIAPTIVGRRVKHVDVLAARQVKSKPAALSALVGRSIDGVGRKGKLLEITAEELQVVFHLRMSGLVIAGANLSPGKHTRVAIYLADSVTLLFNDARRFGGVFVGPILPSLITSVALDPLASDFDLTLVVALGLNSRRQLKPWLMDQKVISGIGNIYADEALFRAGLNPTLPVCTIGKKRIETLISLVQELFLEAIDKGGASIDWAFPSGSMQNELQAYGRHGKECLRCGSTLQYTKINKRGTTWCPHCQPARSSL